MLLCVSVWKLGCCVAECIIVEVRLLSVSLLKLGCCVVECIVVEARLLCCLVYHCGS